MTLTLTRTRATATPCTRREPFDSTPMAVNSISFGSPHERPMGVHRTCGEPNEIKGKFPPEKCHRSLSLSRPTLQGSASRRSTHVPGVGEVEVFDDFEAGEGAYATSLAVGSMGRTHGHDTGSACDTNTNTPATRARARASVGSLLEDGGGAAGTGAATGDHDMAAMRRRSSVQDFNTTPPRSPVGSESFDPSAKVAAVGKLRVVSRSVLTRWEGGGGNSIPPAHPHVRTPRGCASYVAGELMNPRKRPTEKRPRFFSCTRHVRVPRADRVLTVC